MTPSEKTVPSRIARTALLTLSLALLAACGGGKADSSADTEAKDKSATEATAEGENKKPEEKPVPVEVAQVAKRPIQASYHGTAPLEAPNEAQVVAKTSGVLLQLLTEEGDEVKAGQVLERKLVAADIYERIRFDVETQRAAYDMMKLELSYTNIVAPIDGVIAQRMVKQGNLIQLNTALFRIVDARKLEAVLNVPERELATLRQGLEVSMQVDALPGKVFKGTIDRVSPVVDAGSGTFRVTCAFDSNAMLKPGMFGRIGVIYDQREDALTIPRTALLEDAGESAVFAVRDGAAVRVPIEIGFISGELAEIRSGLSEGESVVTAGKVTLRDGIKVEVLNAPKAADPAAVVALSNGIADAPTQP
jgi:membrane fusion protein (multidrug efflux system)